MIEPTGQESYATLTRRHVGLRIRLRRTLLGMTPERLGETLGITAEQVRNYESGANRVPDAQLREMAELFTVPVGFFNEGRPVDGTEWSAPQIAPKGGFAEAKGVFGDDTANRSETLELLQAYNNIADPDRRQQAVELLRSLAQPQ